MQLNVRFGFGLDPYLRIFLRIFQDDSSEKVKNIHDEMKKNTILIKKRVSVFANEVLNFMNSLYYFLLGDQWHQHCLCG